MKLTTISFLSLMALLLAQPVQAQVDIQEVVERNPFDPKRGNKDDELETPEEANVLALPDDVPVLDGTIISANLQIALLAYTDTEGKKVTARAKLDQKIGNYTLTQINPTSVELLESNGKTISLGMFEDGQKKDGSRGGTKKVAKIKKPKASKRKKGKTRRPEDLKPTRKPNAKKSKDYKKRGGLRKRQPPASNNKKSDILKNKF